MKMIDATQKVCEVLKARGMCDGTVLQYRLLLETFAPTAETTEDLTKNDVNDFLTGSYITTRRNGELRKDVDRKRLEHILLNSVDVMAEEGMLTFEWTREKPRRGRKAGSRNTPKVEAAPTTDTAPAAETNEVEEVAAAVTEEPERESDTNPEEQKEVAHLTFNTLFPAE